MAADDLERPETNVRLGTRDLGELTRRYDPGASVVPAAYIGIAIVLLVMLSIYRGATTWPGFVIVALGAPIYLLRRRGAGSPSAEGR